MKHLGLGLLCVGLAAVLLAVSVTRHLGVQARAAVGLSDDEGIGFEATGGAALQEVVEYALVYPGILPDHPLYLVKMVRDRIRLLVTREPLPKSQLLLLYADKRLAAAQALLLKNEVELSVSTAAKAIDYLEQSVRELRLVPRTVGSAMSQWRFMRAASVGYETYLTQLRAGVPEGAQPVLGKMIDRVGAIRGEAEAIVGKPMEIATPEASSSGAMEPQL